MPENEIWRVRAPGQLLWRRWGGREAVVFHVPARDTHYLDAVAASALAALEREPGDVGALTEHVAAELGVAPADGLADQLAGLLAEFERLGIAERGR